LQYPIQIGGVGLSAFEVPSSVRFGGTQRVAVHRLYGGGRVVECLGPDPNEICFEGAFTGPDAALRARTVENLRISGQPVWLTWDSFRYRVVVQTLAAEYRSPWWIGFRIACVVASSPAPVTSLLASVASQIAADVTSTLAAASGLGVDLSGFQAAMSGMQILVPGTTGQVAAQSAVSGLAAALGGMVATQSGNLSADLDAAARPWGMAQSISAAVDAAGSVAAASIASGYVSRIATNLSEG
jgi:hypothetical protein